MTAIGAAASYLALEYPEVLCELALQTIGVESRQRGYLRRLQSGMNERNQPRNIRRIEYDHHVLYIGTVTLNLVAQFRRDLAITTEKILTGHPLFARSPPCGDNIFSTTESLFYTRSKSKIEPLKSTMAHLFCYALQPLGEWIVETNVWSKAHHGSRLCHVGANHTGSSNER